jgi:hypothetical protein
LLCAGGRLSHLVVCIWLPSIIWCACDVYSFCAHRMIDGSRMICR